MQQQEMDSSSFLKKELGPSEELLWFNRPDAKRLRMTGPSGVFLILTLVFGSIGLVLLILALILLLTLAQSKGITIAAGVLFAVGGFFFVVAFVFGIIRLVYRQSSRHTLYGITNQRIIILHTGPILSVDSYTRNDIGYITRREQPDGSGDLIFAGPRFPMYAYNNNYGYNNYNYAYGYGAYGMANTGRFLGIPNVRAAEQVLRETFKLYQ